jgi:hypothetical protein
MKQQQLLKEPQMQRQLLLEPPMKQQLEQQL